MSTPIGFAQAVELQPAGADGTAWQGHVYEGYDIFGIPHGGYLAALGANAVLKASAAPDIFTITTHYMRKASHGAIRFETVQVGGSRRFATWTAVAKQDDVPILSIMASVGDRTQMSGPSWTGQPPPDISPETLGSANGGNAPMMAQVARLRMDTAYSAFTKGETAESAMMQGIAELEPTDQLAAILACDLTPPAVWNVLGASGWVPTVELTAHVRARPEPGPLRISVDTRFVADGFLEEDALVFDQRGTLIVQSRQLARYSQP